MKRLRRLPSKIHPKKNRKDSGFLLLFVLCATLLGAGATYFLLQPVQNPPSSSSIKEVGDLEAKEPPLLWSPKNIRDEGDEDELMDHLFNDSEVVQLYKARDLVDEKREDYWTWPLLKCKEKGRHGALMVTHTTSLKERDLQRLKKLSIPLSFSVSSEKGAYKKLLSPEFSSQVSFFLELSAFPFSLSDEKINEKLNQWLESLIADKPHLKGVITPWKGEKIQNKEFMERLLLACRARGLLLIDPLMDSKSAGENASQSTLSLYVKRHGTLQFKDHSSFIRLQKMIDKDSPFIIFISLHDLLSSRGRHWIQQQKKKGVHFIKITEIFCDPRKSIKE